MEDDQSGIEQRTSGPAKHIAKVGTSAQDFCDPLSH
jgi:hypothetical protein